MTSHATPTTRTRKGPIGRGPFRFSGPGCLRPYVVTTRVGVVAGRSLAHPIWWVTGRGWVLGLSDRCEEEAPMFDERTSVGLDVHARSVVAAGIDGRSGEVFRARLTPSHAEVIEWVGKLPGPCAV